MKVEQIILYMIFLMVGIMMGRTVLLSATVQNPVEAGSATKFLERATGTLWLAADPEVKISSKKTEDDTEYTIDAILNMKFSGESAQGVNLVPVALFKGSKGRGTDIELKSGETKLINMQFKLVSKEPPLLIHVKDREFVCSIDKLKDCEVGNGQKLLLKNFSFEFSAFQIDPSEFPYAPPFLPKIGPCSLNVLVRCPSDKRAISLKIRDEGKNEDKTCAEQEDEKECSQTLKMCGTLANVRLEKISKRESLLEKIAPGSPSCRDRFFAMNINVGEVEPFQFQWKVGEDMTFLFYEKSGKKELEDCWQDDTAECKELFIGQKSITMPIESYTGV